MKSLIIGVVCLLFGLGIGWYRGSYYANLKSFEIGYDLGFQSAIMPGATVTDTSTGKKYKIVEIEEKKEESDVSREPRPTISSKDGMVSGTIQRQ